MSISLTHVDQFNLVEFNTMLKFSDFFDGHTKENLAESHLLIFDLPETSVDEIFIYAELKILTTIDKKDEAKAGDLKIVHNNFTSFIQSLYLQEWKEIFPCLFMMKSRRNSTIFTSYTFIIPTIHGCLSI